MWKSYPIYTIVVEILKKKGSMTDDDMLEAVREFYKDTSPEALNKTLMRMEIAGKITVSTLMKGKRLIELRRQ